MKIDPKLVEQGLQYLETMVEKLIEAKADELADKAVDALKQAIPNDMIDTMVEGARGKFKLHFKKFLLEQADKISPLDNQQPAQVEGQ